MFQSMGFSGVQGPAGADAAVASLTGQGQGGGGQTIYVQSPSSTSSTSGDRAGVLSRGRQSTVLTGGGGVADEINTKRKSLLGE